MSTSTPQAHPLLGDVLSPVLAERQCTHPDCGDWYDPSDPAESYPHNNH